MRTRTVLTGTLILATAAGSLSPAMAATKKKPKPIVKSYQASAPTPDPTPVTGQTGGNCHPTLDTAMDNHKVTIPYASRLSIDLNGFQGDWALGLFTADGDEIATDDQGATDPIDTPAHIDAKFRKKTTVIIRACNFSGGPTANVTYKITAS
jgi:hypothetical protein